jgi:UDP-glucose 4-epimerase
MKKILVTGGCGYIGSHTLVDLIQNGYSVISIDNNSRSNPAILKGVEQITGVSVKNYAIDLCNAEDTHAVFQENPDLVGVIHFAAYKAVGESVENPLLYFHNNLQSLVNVLQCCQDYDVRAFVFSSSCTVYGNPESSPVTETTPFKPAESPYGATKQMGEQLVEQTVKNLSIKSVLLRYFNPVGAHPSIEIGEWPLGKPANLVPVITQTAIGKISSMEVFGTDYPTRDGSCVRDFIHVSDIAHAHTLALNALLQQEDQPACSVYNLGTGNGVTVLEAIKTFEQANGVALKYNLSDRRAGDVIAIFANNEKAEKELGWKPKYSLEDMMKTAWQWEKKLSNIE